VKMKNRVLYLSICSLMLVSLTGCSSYRLVKNLFDRDSSSTSAGRNEVSSSGNQTSSGRNEVSSGRGDVEIDDDWMKILEESGYGEGVDYSKVTYDDPSIPKSMDITQSREAIKEAYDYKFGLEYEPGDMYEKAWWDYIPDSYDLSGDVFPATANYAGEEKHYNNSIEQSVVAGDKFTSGQSLDFSIIQTVADTFIYEYEKNRYIWTADLEEACKRADSLDVADFYSREGMRSWYSGGDVTKLNAPTSLTAHYHTRIVDYNFIGIPSYSGYEFTIDVWEKKDEPVGWVNELEGNKFLDSEEVYENMGEWDFYDELDATDRPDKVEIPDMPNGAKIIRGQKDLSHEAYIYKKIAGGSGNIYYYGNGITVNMTFYGAGQGGNFKDALKYCRIICGN